MPDECKHGLKHGCFYCHGGNTTVRQAASGQPTAKRRTKATRLSEQMNDRMTNLKKRLKEIRGE